MTKDSANEWRDLATKKLEENFKILNPMRRQFNDEDLLGINEIVQMDKEDIKNSDILFVNYNVAREKTTLCGTAMEILTAHQQGKYVVAFTNLPKNEWSPWMIFHSTRILTDFDEAVSYILKHFRDDKNALPC